MMETCQQTIFCHLCKKNVEYGPHPCLFEGRQPGEGVIGEEEHLPLCRCGAFHLPHCPGPEMSCALT